MEQRQMAATTKPVNTMRMRIERLNPRYREEFVERMERYRGQGDRHPEISARADMLRRYPSDAYWCEDVGDPNEGNWLQRLARSLQVRLNNWRAHRNERRYQHELQGR